jgi:hypothetical protein
MIIKARAYFLKKRVEPSTLENYGFQTLNNNHWFKLIGKEMQISFYAENGVFKKRPQWTRRVFCLNGVKKHIKDLIANNLVIRGNYYYFLSLTNYNNWSDEKREKIENKVNKLVKNEYKKMYGEEAHK